MTTEVPVVAEEDVVATEIPVVAVAANSFGDVAALDREFAGRAVLREGPVETPEQVAALTEGASALAVTLHRITAAHVAAMAPSVRVLARAGVGLDTIDLAAAAERGLPIVYQPNYATAEVADQAAALALSAWRRTPRADVLMRADGWSDAGAVGPIGALQESTVGSWGWADRSRVREADPPVRSKRARLRRQPRAGRRHLRRRVDRQCRGPPAQLEPGLVAPAAQRGDSRTPRRRAARTSPRVPSS